jgi:hypothetical protein
MVEIQSSFKNEFKNSESKILDLTALVIRLLNENGKWCKQLSKLENRKR